MNLYDALKKTAPYATDLNIKKYVPLLEESMPRYGIDTKLRQCHFLAQLLHESGSFRYVRELASGEAYEGRKDLGNTENGDGVKFKGRGLIQITGRNNYTRLSMSMFGDERLLETPEILEEPYYAVESAMWFWKENRLNDLADKDDIIAVTRRINGGTNGLSDRMRFYNNLRLVFT